MSHFFDEHQSTLIVKAISVAEIKTDGEIRIHIEDFCDINPVDRAKEVFFKLQMHQTKDKTGVLIYIASEDRKLAIIGDSGIDEKVAPSFWHQIVSNMMSDFKQADYLKGIINGIERVSEVLEKHFPASMHNTNELTNEISYGNI